MREAKQPGLNVVEACDQQSVCSTARARISSVLTLTFSLRLLIVLWRHLSPKAQGHSKLDTWPLFTSFLFLRMVRKNNSVRLSQCIHFTVINSN